MNSRIIETLIYQLQNELPQYQHQLDHRAVSIIQEQVSNLSEYLYQLRTTILLPPSRHQEYFAGVTHVSHDGFPLETGEGYITLYYENGETSTIRGTPHDFGRICHELGIKCDDLHQPYPQPQQPQPQPQPQLQSSNHEDSVIEEFFEMTVDLPSWTIIDQAEIDSPRFDDDDDDNDENNNQQHQVNVMVVAAQLPPLIFRDIKNKDKDINCPICIERFEPSTKIRQLPCNHIFHDNCVFRWFTRSDACPKCRTSILWRLPTGTLSDTTIATHN